MLSSRNLYKQNELSEGQSTKKIETAHQPRKKLLVDEKWQFSSETSTAEMKSYEHQLQSMQVAQKKDLQALEKEHRQLLANELALEKEEFLAELAEMKKQMLVDTQEEVEKLKEEAYASGFKQGEVEGKQAGFVSGERAAEIANQAIRAQVEQLLADAHQSVVDFHLHEQAQVVDLASKMAMNILHREISLSEKDIYLLLEPFLEQLNVVENFITVYVRKEKVGILQEQLEILKIEQPSLRYIVLVDDSLSDLSCILETNYEVLDLEVATQLDRMVTKLNEVNPLVEI